MAYRPAQIYTGSGWDDIGDPRVTALEGSKLATTVTTKGDLISRDSSAPARLGVGSNGQVLTANSSTATGLAWAAGGKILQVVQGSGGADTSTTSTTFVATNQTVTITPSSASSRVLIIAFHVLIRASGGAYSLASQVFRGNASGTGIGDAYLFFTVNSGQYDTAVTQVAIDSPSTANAQLYTTCVRSNNAGITATLRPFQIFAFEVSA
jgi:hypothetical protein